VNSNHRSVEVFGTTFQNPILLAAGTAGFGIELVDVIDLDKLGGIVTKAVSPEPRNGNTGPRVAEFSGGMLNAVGLANPGMEHVDHIELPWLADHVSRARVLVNVVGSRAEDFAAVVRRLDHHAVVTAFELNVSCPNTDRGNEEFAADRSILTDLISGCRDSTDKPLVVKLPPTISDLPGTAETAAQAGADGFTLINTIPGMVFRFDGPDRNPEPSLGFGRGGVSGPALLAVGVLATSTVHERTGLPIIGVGGVCTLDDVRQYLTAGASLVAVGTASFADPRVPQRLAAAWTKHG
jgi:dihydroorotate dehydrogenase (NAD+) catalytic subunit